VPQDEDGLAVPDPRLTTFSYRRQRLDGSGSGALAAVEAALGVYAANPSGPLSILARAPATTASDVLGLEREGLVVRGRAMRTSAFVLSVAMAPTIAAATAQPVERFAWMLRVAGVAPDAFDAARTAVVRAAGEPRTARELRTAAALDGVDVARLVAYLALRGDLVTLGAASVTSNQSRYVARAARTAPRAGAALAADLRASAPGSEAPPPARTGPVPTVDAARAWLAGAYLQAFGPARVEDLAWWAGVPRSAAAAALAAHETVDTGDGLLVLARDRPAYESSPPLAGELVLVPKWDAWTMGYPVDGRSRFVDRDVHDRLFDGDGNGLGAVLVSGRAVGAWGHRGARGRMDADLDLFERPAPRTREAIETRLGVIAAFLGYRELRVREVPTVVPNRPRVRRPLA
jgi:hypothetical protein